MHYHSSVDEKYKIALVRTMLHRAYRISSSWIFLHEECKKLKKVFVKLCYPITLLDKLINSTINNLYQSNAKSARDSSENTSVPLVLPFKTQKNSKLLCKELDNLNRRIKMEIAPVFTSQNVDDLLRKCEQRTL